MLHAEALMYCFALTHRGPPKLKELVGIATKRCQPLENGNAKALSELEADKLRGQTPGWRIMHEEGGNLVLTQDWKVDAFALHRTVHPDNLSPRQADGL